MDQLVRDIAAIVIILGGCFVAYLKIQQYKQCKKPYAWIYIVAAFAGFSTAALLVGSLLRLYMGGDTISPMFGRPVYIMLLLALILEAIHSRRTAGGC